MLKKIKYVSSFILVKSFSSWLCYLLPSYLLNSIYIKAKKTLHVFLGIGNLARSQPQILRSSRLERFCEKFSLENFVKFK